MAKEQSKPSTAEQPEFLSVAQARAILGVSDSLMRLTLPAIGYLRVGTRIIIPRQRFDAFIEKQLVQQAAPQEVQRAVQSRHGQSRKDELQPPAEEPARAVKPGRGRPRKLRVV